MKMFVGNLSRETTEDDLRQIFGEFGAVESVAIITDRLTGDPRGFAFVEMNNPDEARAAIEAIPGREVHNMEIAVNEARPRPERPRGNFGGDRGGDRGGSGGDRGGYSGGRGGSRGGFNSGKRKSGKGSRKGGQGRGGDRGGY